MAARTLYVGCGDGQVAVSSAIPEVLAGLVDGYREMLRARPTLVVGRLAVEEREGEYHLALPQGAEIRAPSLAEALEHLSYQVALCLIEANPGLVWLHAGAVAGPGGAVVLPAASCRGKSTLVAALCLRGWTYLSDDIVPLDPRGDAALPFPRAPALRKHPGRELPPVQVAKLPKVRLDLPPGSVGREASPVQALVFPEYSPTTLVELRPCSPSDAVLGLLQSCLNFPVHREGAVEYLCRLVERVPAYRLSFARGDFAANAIEERFLRSALQFPERDSERQICSQP